MFQDAFSVVWCLSLDRTRGPIAKAEKYMYAVKQSVDDDADVLCIAGTH